MKTKLDKTKYCCELMASLLKEDKVHIGYSNCLREYYIKLRRSSAAIQEIFYCPWCGKKLPGSLRDEWFHILRSKYALENPADDKKKIPKEFRTDKWWKKQGL